VKPPYVSLSALAENTGSHTTSALSEGVVLENGLDIRPTAIQWLWRDWLAVGKLHVLAGSPGQGKTTLMLSMVAVVTRGGAWPDGSACRRGRAIIWSGEDDVEDTLAPRLISMGADMSCVYFVRGTRVGDDTTAFDPARDLEQLTSAARRIGDVVLVGVDPLVSVVAGDSHKNSEVRRSLQPLVDLASNLDVAVIGISHFAKGGKGKDPTERVVGSVAFGAVARLVMVAAKVRGLEGEDRRVLARSKSNIGPEDGGFEYSLEQIELADHPGVFASRVVWGRVVSGSASDLLAHAESHSDADVGNRAHVVESLRQLLANGSQSVAEIRDQTTDMGFAFRTVQRAADQLGVKRHKDGMRGGWHWSLSNTPIRVEDAEGANALRLSSSGSSVAPSAEDGEVL